MTSERSKDRFITRYTPGKTDHQSGWFGTWVQKTPIVAREIVTGGLAGGVAKTSVAPLERCKILYQTGRLHHTGVIPTMKSIVRVEGVKGLFKGNGASVLRIIPYSAIHFGLYEHFRRSFVVVTYGDDIPDTISTLIDLVAGSCSGATAVLLTYPLDIVRTRLAYISEGGSIPTENGNKSTTMSKRIKLPRHGLTAVRHHETIRTVLHDTIQREGVRGLYHGIGPSIYGILPYAGLKFFVYQQLKQMYHHSRNTSDKRGQDVNGRSKSMEHRLPVPVMLCFGGIAGLIAQTATYPIDVVRRRMQVEGLKAMERRESNGGDLLPRSTPGALLRIATKEGWRSLFSGLSINYMKVVPSTAIGFTLYDFLKSQLYLSTNL